MRHCSAHARALAVVCALAFAGAFGCGSPAVGPGLLDGGGADTFVCTVQAPTECPDPPPRFQDVAPIVGARCAGCHYGAVGGPWPLLDYSHVADWQDVIRTALLDCSMPPPESYVPMTDGERVAILRWIRCGAMP